MRLRINWGVGIAAVYTIFATGTLTFAWFAMRQPVDLVSGDYYQRAIAHDAQRAAIERGLTLGSDLEFGQWADGRRLAVMWKSAKSSPREGTITLYRASNPAWDRHWPVTIDSEGRQVLDLADLPAGEWLVQLRWIASDGEYYVERPVTVR